MMNANELWILNEAEADDVLVNHCKIWGECTQSTRGRNLTHHQRPNQTEYAIIKNITNKTGLIGNYSRLNGQLNSKKIVVMIYRL